MVFLLKNQYIYKYICNKIMNKKKIFTDNDLKEIIRLYTVEKLGTPSIGKLYNVDKGVINRLLKENNVVIDTPGRRDLGGKKISDKKYYLINKDKISEYYKEWSKNNRNELREYHSEWREKNRDILNLKSSEYERNRRRDDPKYRLCARTRTAVYTCLKERNINKNKATFDLLGYSLDDLIVHLESKFVDGMTWENYGEWHVDHIIPMSSFNFNSINDNEFKICWSISNLQPLWSKDNLIKGSKII